MHTNVTHFVERLATATVSPRLCNQYAVGPPQNEVRRRNLRLYLQQMAQRRPHTLLVGEAAGHRGCRLSGVPFTSEHILLNGTTAHNLFGEEQGYCKTRERQRVMKEQSATIVWSVLDRLPHPPLLWNALPFHPHKRGQPWSNRTPLQSELALGRPFLRLLLQLYPIEQIIAVGVKAFESLTRWQLDCLKVRHPSHGGKTEFVGGIHTLLGGDAAQGKRP